MKIKTHTFVPAILCGVIITAAPALRAQTSAPAAPAAATPTAPAAGGDKGGRKGGDMLDRLTTELGLTDDQKAKIKPILDARRDKMKAIHDDSSLSDDQKKAKMKEAFDASTADIKAILTADQAKKYDDLVQKMEERRKARSNN